MQPTTLITGAGRRIGAVLAHHLAARGHKLVLHYHQSQTEAEALAAELRTEHGTEVTLTRADLSNLASLNDFWAGLPPVTHLIHNASTYTRDTLASFTLEQLRTHMRVNFEAPLLLTQGYVAQLPVGIQGTVTLLGDGIHGWSISPEFFSYAISKQAWESSIDLLAAALAPRARANVIALAPTLPNTGEDEALFARLAARAPLQRTGDVAEICATVDFLLANPAITGQVLSLANGMGLVTKRPLA